MIVQTATNSGNRDYQLIKGQKYSVTWFHLH